MEIVLNKFLQREKPSTEAVVILRCCNEIAFWGFSRSIKIAFTCQFTIGFYNGIAVHAKLIRELTLRGEFIAGD